MKLFAKFNAQDLVFIAVLSGLSIVIKPIVSPIVHMISTPLMLPGGSLAGGIYMLWLSLAMAIIKKPGACLLIALTQAVVIFITGSFGSHGFFSLISYTLPGLAAELVAFPFTRKDSLLIQILICTIANLTGSSLVSLVILNLPWIPFFISAGIAIISGILGGILAYYIYQSIRKITKINYAT